MSLSCKIVNSFKKVNAYILTFIHGIKALAIVLRVSSGITNNVAARNRIFYSICNNVDSMDVSK